MTMTSKNSTFYRRFGKRLFDLALTAPALVLLAPLLAIVAIVVRLGLGRGILFKQSRPGLHGKPFVLYKFRTMVDLYDDDGNLLPDQERITKLGSCLRRLSIDELPQLWNVVRGDISLVGPRPQLAKYVLRCTREQLRRHDVPPGITGWAQVNGRNSISWEERFRLDVWYVDHATFLLDLQILWKTIWIVLTQAGISAKGHVTMPEFLGTTQLATMALGGDVTGHSTELVAVGVGDSDEDWSEADAAQENRVRELVAAGHEIRLDGRTELGDHEVEPIPARESSKNGTHTRHATGHKVNGSNVYPANGYPANGHGVNGHAANGKKSKSRSGAKHSQPDAAELLVGRKPR